MKTFVANNNNNNKNDYNYNYNNTNNKDRVLMATTTAQQSSSVFSAQDNHRTGGALGISSVSSSASMLRSNNISLSRLNYHPSNQRIAAAGVQQQEQENKYHHNLNYYQDHHHHHWRSSSSALNNTKSSCSRAPITPFSRIAHPHHHYQQQKQQHQQQGSQPIRLHRNRVLLERANNNARKPSTSVINNNNHKTSNTTISSDDRLPVGCRNNLSSLSRVRVAPSLQGKENTCCILETRSRPIIRQQAASATSSAAVTNSLLRQGALYARRCHQYHMTPLSISANRFSATSLTSLNYHHQSSSCLRPTTTTTTTTTTTKTTRHNNSKNKTTNKVVSTITCSKSKSVARRGTIERGTTNSHATALSELYNNNLESSCSFASNCGLGGVNSVGGSHLNANRSIADLLDRTLTEAAAAGAQLNHLQSVEQLAKGGITTTSLASASSSSSKLKQPLERERDSEKSRIGYRRFSLASSTSSLSLAVVKKVKPSPSGQQSQKDPNSNLNRKVFVADKGTTAITSQQARTQSYRRSSWSSCSDFNSSSCNSTSCGSSSSISTSVGGCATSASSALTSSRLVLFSKQAATGDYQKYKSKEEERAKEKLSYLNGKSTNRISVSDRDRRKKSVKRAENALESTALNTSNKKIDGIVEEAKRAETATTTRVNSNNTNNSTSATSSASRKRSSISGSGRITTNSNNKSIQQISVASGPQNKPKINNNTNVRSNKNRQMAANINIIKTDSNNNLSTKQKALTSSNNIITNTNKDNDISRPSSFASPDNNDNKTIVISDNQNNMNNNEELLAFNSQRETTTSSKEDCIRLPVQQQQPQPTNSLDIITMNSLNTTFPKLGSILLKSIININTNDSINKQQLVEKSADLLDQAENMPPPSRQQQQQQQTQRNSFDNNSDLKICNLLNKKTISTNLVTNHHQLNNNLPQEVGETIEDDSSCQSLVKEKNHTTTCSNNSIVDMQTSRTSSLRSSRNSLGSDDRMILGSPLITPPASELDLVEAAAAALDSNDNIDNGSNLNLIINETNTQCKINKIDSTKETTQKVTTKELKKEEKHKDDDFLEETPSQNKKQKKDPIDIPIRQDSINDYYDLEARPFARGKFAQVKRCINKTTKQCFAAKCIKKRRRLVDIRHEILLEIEALKLSYHTNRIIRLYEVYETANEMILILELAKGGELQRVLDDEELICEKLVKKMVKQILEGLIELHDNDIAHLDIKPQNLLLTESFPSGDIKLCDFGISRRITKDCDIREICGTPDYVAPEILRYDPISLTTDMWSLGVLTYVLLSGYSPFGSENKQQTFCNITQATLDFPNDIFDNNKISKDAIDFIQKLIVREPAERLTSRQARNHSWLINE